MAATLLAGLLLWSYWPALVEMVDTWNRVPDYSHGFLVPPLALLILWTRRSSFPGLSLQFAWPGLLVLLCSQAIRIVGAVYFLSSLDGWSMVVWLLGVVWFLGGARLAWWALPSIAFLFFMVPLPYGVERMASGPLQWGATKASSWVLQSLGQPAIAEGNTILLGSHRLEVEQACSGLRLFMGIVALAYVYLVVTRRVWWEKAVLVASVLPIALASNTARIAGTAFVYQWVSEEAGKKFSHDVAGWMMMPLAALLFSLVLLYLSKLTYEVEQAGVRVLFYRGNR